MADAVVNAFKNTPTGTAAGIAISPSNHVYNPTNEVANEVAIDSTGAKVTYAPADGKRGVVIGYSISNVVGSTGVFEVILNDGTDDITVDSRDANTNGFTGVEISVPDGHSVAVHVGSAGAGGDTADIAIFALEEA